MLGDCVSVPHQAQVADLGLVYGDLGDSAGACADGQNRADGVQGRSLRRKK